MGKRKLIKQEHELDHFTNNLMKQELEIWKELLIEEKYDSVRAGTGWHEKIKDPSFLKINRFLKENSYVLINNTKNLEKLLYRIGYRTPGLNIYYFSTAEIENRKELSKCLFEGNKDFIEENYKSALLNYQKCAKILSERVWELFQSLNERNINSLYHAWFERIRWMFDGLKDFVYN